MATSIASSINGQSQTSVLSDKGKEKEKAKVFYNAPVPRTFICPIATRIMKHPMTLHCGQDHVFEDKCIRAWLTVRKKTCPVCEEPATLEQLERNRVLEELIPNWRQEHRLEKITSSFLANLILNETEKEYRTEMLTECLSEIDPAMIQKVAKKLYAQVSARKRPMPDIMEKGAQRNMVIIGAYPEASIELKGKAASALRNILDEVNRMLASKPSSPQGSESSLGEQMKSLIQLQTEYLQTQREASEAKRQGEERQRQLLAESQRPLSWWEWVKVGFVVGAPIAASIAGRAYAAEKDHNPETTASSEALNVDIHDMSTIAMQVGSVGVAFTEGTSGFRKLASVPVMSQISSVSSAASCSFQRSMIIDRERERKQDMARLENVISTQSKDFSRLRDESEMVITELRNESAELRKESAEYKSSMEARLSALENPPKKEGGASFFNLFGLFS